MVTVIPVLFSIRKYQGPLKLAWTFHQPREHFVPFTFVQILSVEKHSRGEFLRWQTHLTFGAHLF
jgi:hypothetical protein